MNIMEIIESYKDYFIIGMLITILLLLIIVIALIISQAKLKKKYKIFMKGSNGKSLEKQIFTRFSEIENLKEDVVGIHNDIRNINGNLLLAYQKIGVVKYDAFKETGGKLSFVIAILNKNNSGFLLNSVHSSTEGCYTYLKEIINGESFLELSNDENKALDMAINQDNYME